MKSFLKNFFQTRYWIWWFATLLIFFWFDLQWCFILGFRAMTAYISFYLFLPLAATVFSLPAALSRRNWPQAVTLLLIAALHEANLLYCRTYFVQIPIESYTLVGNLSGFWGAVWYALRWSDLLFVAIIVSAWLLTKHNAKKLPFANYLLLLVAFAMPALASVQMRGGFKQRFDAMTSQVLDQNLVGPVYTIFASLIYEATQLDTEATTEDIKLVNQWFETHDSVTDCYSSPERADSLQPSSLVLLICESLESWPIGLSLEGKEITPFINSLLADSTALYFPNVKTEVGDGRSIDGQLLYLTGQYPLTRGVFSTRYAQNPYRALPHELAKNGFKSYMMTCDFISTWNQGTIAQSFGYDSLLTAENLCQGKIDVMHDGDFFTAVVKRLSSGEIWPDGENALATFITHSGHAPFDNPESVDHLGLKDDYPKTLRDYLTVTNYMDRQLHILFDYLRQRKDWSHMAIVITGDHEGLASWRADIAAKCKFVDSRQHTPLLILNAPRQGVDSTEISQADVYAALLETMGLYDKASWRGMGYPPIFPITKSQNADISDYSDTRRVADLIIRHPEIIK